MVPKIMLEGGQAGVHERPIHVDLAAPAAWRPTWSRSGRRTAPAARRWGARAHASGGDARRENASTPSSAIGSSRTTPTAPQRPAISRTSGGSHSPPSSQACSVQSIAARSARILCRPTPAATTICRGWRYVCFCLPTWLTYMCCDDRARRPRTLASRSWHGCSWMGCTHHPATRTSTAGRSPHGRRA
jgi:hypothetical protein